jgi:hypothetical protein
MAESTDKAADGAEKAYAAAAAEAKPVAAEAAKPEPVAVPAPVKAPAASAPKTEVAKAAPKKVAEKKKAAPKKVVAKRIKKPAAKAKPVAGTKSVPAKASLKTPPVASKPTITQLKEKIMATAKTTTDFTKPFADAVGELQAKTKDAYEKGTAYAGEMTDFAKGNVEALVESGKVLSAGMQDVGKTYVGEAKAAYETLTGDLKEMAAIKSPTELFQLQGKIARRNFETMVAFSSKTGDTMMKLYGDAFAPISGRVSLAAEKLSKAA